MKCVHKEPERRYANPGFLLEDLESLRKKQTPMYASNPLTETIQLAVRRVGKNKLLYPASGALLIFSLLIFFVFLRPGKNIPPETARLLNRIELLIDDEKFDFTWEEYDKIPAESRELHAVRKIKNILLNNRAKKIQAILDDDKTDLVKAWEEYEKIPSGLKNDVILSPIIYRLNEKWHSEVKVQLTYNFLASTPAIFPDKFYTTTRQHAFNEIFRLSKDKNYSAAYQRLDTDFIEINDPEISPPAIYFKMKLLLEEKAENHLAGMEGLFKKLNKIYPASYCTTLSEVLLNQSLLYQDKIYNNYLAQLIDGSLDSQLELLTEFVKSYPDNTNISKAREQIKNIKRDIFRRQSAYYKELIVGIKKKLDVKEKSSYLLAIKDLQIANKIALEIEENQESLNELEYRIEKGYLALCGIRTEGKNKIGFLYQYIKNIADISEMILIPRGEFTMGSNEGTDDEKPAHQVNQADYYIDKYEISNTQFEVFVKATGYKTDAEKSGKGWVWTGTEIKEIPGATWHNPDGTGKGIKMNHPVVQVSWNDASAYAEWAGKRLPKEAEWEKAARGLMAFSYPWGNEWQADYCNNITSEYFTTTTVGNYEKGKSPYDCYNMAGNVAEWCLDWYLGPYTQTLEKLPDEKIPVLRGGAFNLPKEHLRSTARQTGYFLKQSDFRASHIGFRCVKDVNTDIQSYLEK
ncbi:MAG: formylglycine-generating enzyme family protein [Planctomycetota bacterium]